MGVVSTDEKSLKATEIPTIVISAPSMISKAASKESPRSSFFCQPLLNLLDKRAKKSAHIVHDLIIGPQQHKHTSRSRLKRLKSQLIDSKSANKVIAHLRVLPTQGPIHAVCLANPDAQAQELHFSALSDPKDFLNGLVSLDEVSSILSKIGIINLISHPSIGIGEPGNGKGLLSGALPTPETVLKGFKEITPQLMALGYATGRSVFIDHTGVYPPTDRMSVLTYWWGLELVLPPPSLKHLTSVHSITNTILNFLTALSILSAGIRELLPFIRYIAQFVDFEFDEIVKQDHGQGVVCASTWIMPAALVARAWDFEKPPTATPVIPATPAEPTPQPSPITNASPLPTLPLSTATTPFTSFIPPLPTATASLTSITPPPSLSTPLTYISPPLPTAITPPLPATTTPPLPSTPAPTSQLQAVIIPTSLSNLANTIVGAYKDSVTFQPEVAAASSGPTAGVHA